MNDDARLIDAMRRGDMAAWGVFAARYRPVLEGYARRVKLPAWEWPVCVYDVLDDEAMRIVSRETPLPKCVDRYLITAVKHRYLRLKRDEDCLDRYHNAASENRSGEWVVSALCSEDSLRSSAGPDEAATSISNALQRLATELRAAMTEEEVSVVTWVSERVPQWQISKWLGVSDAAGAKRIWRLLRRLQAKAAERSATYSVAERSEIDRFLRRAGRRANAPSTIVVRARP